MAGLLESFSVSGPGPESGSMHWMGSLIVPKLSLPTVNSRQVNVYFRLYPSTNDYYPPLPQSSTPPHPASNERSELDVYRERSESLPANSEAPLPSTPSEANLYLPRWQKSHLLSGRAEVSITFPRVKLTTQASEIVKRCILSSRLILRRQRGHLSGQI